jgi:hypothetical protein
MTTKHTIIVQGGPLNDHDATAEREVEVEGDELLSAYAAIPGASRGGELIEPPLDPPPSIKLYHRFGGGSTYKWASKGGQ